LTLLLSAGEFACALFSPKLLVPIVVENDKSQKSGLPKTRSASESTKKLLDELDNTVKHEDGAKRNEK